MGDIDLLVVNHNTQVKLQRFLETLRSDMDDYTVDWKLYVADNGSNDDSAFFLHSNLSSYPIYRLYINDNIGYARAINKMAQNSDSRYLMALNADVWLTTKDVADLVKFMDNNPDVGICGPKQRDEGGRIRHAGIFGPHSIPTQRDFGKLDPNDNMHREVEECLTVSGSAFLVRRSVWEKLAECEVFQDFHRDFLREEAQGAMPNLPHFFEETLVSYHLSAHPEWGKVVYNGEVSIGHSWHASSKKGSRYVRDGFRTGRKAFRHFCDMHNIPHD